MSFTGRSGQLTVCEAAFVETPATSVAPARLKNSRRRMHFLPMPLLVLAGEKASGTFLIDQARLVASDVTGTVIKGSGHWLMEEAPEQVIPPLVAFLSTPG